MRILKNSFAKQSNFRGNLDFLNGFPAIYIFEYQGSRQSAEEGIIRVFDKALKKADINQVGLMFFDEIGIAELSTNKPLKVLHEYLGKSNEIDKTGKILKEIIQY